MKFGLATAVLRLAVLWMLALWCRPEPEVSSSAPHLPKYAEVNYSRSTPADGGKRAPWRERLNAIGEKVLYWMMGLMVLGAVAVFADSFDLQKWNRGVRVVRRGKCPGVPLWSNEGAYRACLAQWELENPDRGLPCDPMSTICQNGITGGVSAGTRVIVAHRWCVACSGHVQALDGPDEGAEGWVPSDVVWAPRASKSRRGKR